MPAAHLNSQDHPQAPTDRHKSGRLLGLLTPLSMALLLGGCAALPGSGPTYKEIEKTAEATSNSPIQVIDVNDSVTRRLLAQRKQLLFSETLGSARPTEPLVGAGDALEVSLWEAPPATLFGAGAIDPRAPATSHSTTLPEQLVDGDGYINVPFAGRILAAGKSTTLIAADIVQRLRGKANQPEALVRRVRNVSSAITVVGEVNTSQTLALHPGGVRLLDALAAAGGVRQPINKTSVQVTRGATFHSLPLDVVIRDPRQNVPLQAGDVVSAIFQPLSFTALGATGRNEEVNFETQGITLAQALARAGGVLDTRAHPQGAFIFRFEPENALDWPRQPTSTTPEGMVPVVYRFDLRDPGSFFVMQSFAMNNKDVLFVSNAPATELQRFLNLVSTLFYPAARVDSLIN
jgi:polysaccharide biosynthesis/export protein